MNITPADTVIAVGAVSAACALAVAVACVV